MSSQSPLIVPAEKVVASSRVIVPSGKVVTNLGECEHAGAFA